MKHGVNGYDNFACRCDVCRSANTAAQARRRAQRRARIGIDCVLPPGVKHGASAYDNWCCRCWTCRDEHANTERTRRVARSG